MAVTLKQLSSELGLDYSTVSYALSGKGSINEATRQRVREAAERLGYVPNGLARRMRNQQTHSLGLVLPDSILMYNELMQQLYRGAAERDYELQIALTEFQKANEERAVRSLLEARVDGMIVRSHYARWKDVPANSALRQAAAGKVPTISYGPTLAASPFPSVELPIGDRTRRAAAHLLELGHTRLACLLPVEAPIFGPHVSAIEGMKSALLEFGADPNSLQVLALEGQEIVAEDGGEDAPYGNYLNEILPRHALLRGRALLQQALSHRPHATGLVCYNAVVAIGVLQGAQQLGLRVPDDIAVVSVTRSLVAELAPISLTTCDVPPLLAARATLQLLFETMNGKAKRSVRRTVEPVLRVGDSTVLQPKTNVETAAARMEMQPGAPLPESRLLSLELK